MTPRSGHKVMRGVQLLDVCASALGMNDRIGAVAAGHRSDMALLDLDHPDLVPLTDPVNQIVHAETGRTVDNVMVGGRLVLDGGRFSIVNLPDIRRKVTDLLAARTETNREAKYYSITKAGLRGLHTQTERWRRLAGLVEKLLLDEG